jgi:hypothetical protein
VSTQLFMSVWSNVAVDYLNQNVSDEEREDIHEISCNTLRPTNSSSNEYSHEMVEG